MFWSSRQRNVDKEEIDYDEKKKTKIHQIFTQQQPPSEISLNLASLEIIEELKSGTNAFKRNEITKYKNIAKKALFVMESMKDRFQHYIERGKTIY